MKIAMFRLMLAVAAVPAVVAAGPAGRQTCPVLGDSNALRLKPVEPQCVTIAKNGITSDEVLAIAPPDVGYARVIVSMGGNDWRTRAPLAANLVKMRALYPHSRFIWLAPFRGRNADIVAAFGAEHNDLVVRLGDFPSRDNAHPINPADVAARLQ